MAGPSERHYLTPLFEPAAVAVVGATERPGAVGAVLIRSAEGPMVKRVTLALD